MFKGDIQKQTIKNNYYRKVVHTTKESQLVYMSLLPSEDIPEEQHIGKTQFIGIESGKGICKINDKSYKLKDGDAIIIPENTLHYVKVTGNEPLKLYAVYSPPEHPDKLIQKRQPI